MSDAIVLGLAIGPAAVVAYGVTQRLFLLADAQVVALGGSAWAALAELHHQSQFETFNRRLTQLTRWTGILSFTLACPLAAGTRPFVGMWVGPERYGGDLLAVATAVYVWGHATVALWGWPLFTTGRVRALLPPLAVAMGLNAAVSVAGAVGIGTAGPAIGSAFGYMVLIVWVPFVLRREFGTPLEPLARAVVAPALLGLPYGVGTWLIASDVSAMLPGLPGWRQWAALVGVSAAAAGCYLALALWLVVPGAERRELLSRVPTW